MAKMTKINKFNGGVRITRQYLTENPNGNANTACEFFISNSTYSVLTNSSISCITLVVTLNDGIISPFKSIRSDHVEDYVNKLLLKVFITNTQKGWYDIQGRGPFYDTQNRPSYGIEVTSYDAFKAEIKTQIDIYKRSMSSNDSPLDPICPAIVNSITLKKQKYIDFYRRLLGLKQNEIAKLGNILDAFGKNNNTISIIVMEYLDGFDTANNVLNKLRMENNNDRFNYLLSLVLYEFQRLNKLGYRHGDAHLGNSMINPNYKYFTRSGNPSYLGRVIIIDFGRTRKFNNMELNRLNNNDITLFQEEVHGTLNFLNIPYINDITLNTLREWRKNYLNSITIPKLFELFKLEPNTNLQNYIINNIINNPRYVYTLGGRIYKDDIVDDKIENNNSISDEIIPTKNIKTSTKIPDKMYPHIIPTMEDNNFIRYVQEQINNRGYMTPMDEVIMYNAKHSDAKNNLFPEHGKEDPWKALNNNIKLEMAREEAMDKSLFVTEPIDEEWKNKTQEEVNAIFAQHVLYQEDILEQATKQIDEINISNKTGGKKRLTKSKKPKSNRTRKNKK
jgi:hypothetical protein